MNKENQSNASRVLSWIFIIIVVVVLLMTFQTYKKYYFGDFTKAENQMHISKFSRDKYEKCTQNSSYKIESLDYNDAVFYKEIEVKPNTPYKVTCKVKTENVVQEEENNGAGAMICLLETTEVSKNIIGTKDWEELTFIFNSKNKEKVKIAFRLGGNTGDCKGIAWFSDLKIEEGIANSENDTKWKFACFIFEKIQVSGEENLDISMTTAEIENIKQNIQRFQNTCETISNGKMSAQCDIYEVSEPITTLSYNEDYKYHIAPEDVQELITDIVLEKEYDHVMAIVKMGDDNSGIAVNVGDWIGLRWYGDL